MKRKPKARAESATRAKAVSPARARSTPRPATARAAAFKSRGSANRPLAMAVLEQFRLIFRSAKKHFQWVQERTGVSGAQLWVLAELSRRPGLRVTELAKAMAVHQSTASNLIDPLEKRGLIQCDRSTQDQRVVHLTLTKSGRETIARAPLPLEGVLPDALNSLGNADLVALQQRLEKLASRMKVRDSAGKRILLSEM
jgi:MarR family transcriptional regulator, organic hydroperoxide resistance regulator